MRKLRLFFILLFSLMLFPSVSIRALAAEYEAASFEELEAAFHDNSGENVRIRVTDHIDFDGYPLTAKEGITYDIVGADGVILEYAQFNGSGIVNIYADLTEEKGSALLVEETVTVNLVGDINTKVRGVNASDNSTVTVTGEINARDAVYAEGNSVVSVKGNMTAGMYGTANGTEGMGITTHGNGMVTVDGDITAREGIQANNNSTITVNGNITATMRDGACVWEDGKINVNGNISARKNGVLCFRNGTVTVNGEIVAGECGVTVQDTGTVTIDGSITGGSGDPDSPAASSGYYGVGASGSAVVNVTGNVAGGEGYGIGGQGGTAVIADCEAKVTIGGNAAGGGVTATSGAEPENEENQSQGGSGVWMYHSAEVSVGGDALGGASDVPGGNGGNGIVVAINDGAADPGRLTVAGNAQGMGSSSDIFISNFTQEDVPAARIPVVTVGAYGSIDGSGFSEDVWKEISGAVVCPNKPESSEAAADKTSVFDFLRKLLLG